MSKPRLVTPEICAHYHSGKNYEIHVSLPKVEKENIELNVHKKGFSVKGTGPDVIFAASRTLDHPIDVKKVKTQYYEVQGLLEITAPLLKSIACRKVPIK